MQCLKISRIGSSVFCYLTNTRIFLLNSSHSSKYIIVQTKAMATKTENGLTAGFKQTESNATLSPTAGIIIIGDEILKGQTSDTNTSFLTKRLKELGVNVRRISVIPDDIDIIANEVRNFSRDYRYVFTSGGVGPTHDDLTWEGKCQYCHRAHF